MDLIADFPCYTWPSAGCTLPTGTDFVTVAEQAVRAVSVIEAVYAAEIQFITVFTGRTGAHAPAAYSTVAAVA